MRFRYAALTSLLLIICSGCPHEGKLPVKIINNSEVKVDIVVTGKPVLSVSPKESDTIKLDYGAEVEIRYEQYHGKFVLHKFPFVHSVECEVSSREALIKTHIISQGEVDKNFGAEPVEGTQKEIKITAVNGKTIGANDRVAILDERYAIGQKPGLNELLCIDDLMNSKNNKCIQQGEEFVLHNWLLL